MSTHRAGGDLRTWLHVAAGLAARPSLWGTTARQAAVMTPSRWWAHRPRLPVPDAAYARFRALTQYGDPEHRFDRRDLVEYLTWCRSWRRALR